MRRNPVPLHGRALGGHRVRRRGATVGACTRRREDVHGTLRDPAAAVGVLCVSQSRPLRVPMSHLGDARETLFHGAEKPVCAPCRSPSAGAAAQPRKAGGASQHSRRRAVNTVLAQRRCDGRYRGVIGPSWSRRGEQREKERRRSRPPHTANVRGRTCFRSKGPWGRERAEAFAAEAAPGGRRQRPDDAGAARCARWAAGCSSRASLLLMRPRRTTPGLPRRREREHSPGPERASTR